MNKKQRIVHGQGASTINYSTIVFKFDVGGFPNQSPLLTVSRGDWLGNPANIKLENNGAVVYGGSSLTAHSPLLLWCDYNYLSLILPQ